MDKVDYYKKAAKNKKERIDLNIIKDVEKLRNEYETTEISIRNLAIKNNVSFKKLERIAIKKKWSTSKKIIQEEIRVKLKEKSVESIVDKQLAAVNKHYNISNKIFKNIENALGNNNELYTFVEKIKVDRDQEELKEIVTRTMNDKKMLNFVNAVDKLQKMQRQTLDIMDIQDKKKLELEEKKLVQEDTEDNTKAIKEFIEATKPSKTVLKEIGILDEEV